MFCVFVHSSSSNTLFSILYFLLPPWTLCLPYIVVVLHVCMNTVRLLELLFSSSQYCVLCIDLSVLFLRLKFYDCYFDKQ